MPKAMKKWKQTTHSSNTPSGSHAATQPIRQPGSFDLFDRDPRVRTGTMDPNLPMDTYTIYNCTYSRRLLFNLFKYILIYQNNFK